MLELDDIGSGASTVGRGGMVLLTVGSGTCGAGGSAQAFSGRSNANTGGALSLGTGEGTATTSGAVTLLVGGNSRSGNSRGRESMGIPWEFPFEKWRFLGIPGNSHTGRVLILLGMV